MHHLPLTILDAVTFVVNAAYIVVVGYCCHD